MKQTQQNNPFIVLDENLPEAFQARLLELQIGEKVWFFELGDVANDIWRWCVDNRAAYRIDAHTTKPFTFELVCWFVGRKLDGTHGTTSIYNYANLAQRLKDKRLRHKYQLLPISHFNYACQFDDANMRRVLDYSLEQTDIRGGRPPSRDSLIKHFEPEKFKAQRDDMDDVPPADLDGLPAEDDPIWDNTPLPVNYEEIKMLNNAFQYLGAALQRFKRQNPQFEVVSTIIQTIMDLNQKLLKTIAEQVRE